MKALRRPILAVLFLAGVHLSLAGCAGVPFAKTELTPTSPRSAAELTRGLWSGRAETLMVRHSALFEMRGMRVPVAAMMRLDLRAREARLVGMNDMGVKLYDITVAAGSTRANFVIPDLERYPGFAEAVGTSVARIFLDPLPAADDLLKTGTRSYLLQRKSTSGATLGFLIGGSGEQLLEKSARGPQESWRVRYYQYRPTPGGPFPGGIVLDDEGAGYRLTLWIEEVEKSDE